MSSRLLTNPRAINSDKYSFRLSAEMGTKVSANESAVENVSIKNRPMNVSDEYHNLCSNAWLDAKTILDEVKGDSVISAELDKVQLLCDVMKVSN